MAKNKSWGDYYNTPLSIIGFISDIAVHVYFIAKIFKLKERSNLEVGCGTASHTIFLSFFVERCIILDRDERVISTAKKNICKFKRDNIAYIRADAYHIPLRNKSIGNCFSQGFLEHFNDTEVPLLLLEQTRVAKRAIFSVPSKNYPTIDYGNEKLLDIMEWDNIINNRFRRYRIDYYSFDLSIRTRLLLFKKLIKTNYIYSFIQSIRLPLHIIGEVEN